MIQSLEIHNFQSHKHSKLEFADGVNVIVGASDSGKTTIIRALRWLIWNRPTGDAFRSTWGGSTSVDIVMDGQNIIRVKDQAGSEYALGETVFKAFGTEVPEEILQALNINEINLQQQLDSPFLLSNSSGEVAQHFNRVAHLDQIDNGLRKVQQWIRSIEQNIDSNERQSEQLEEDLRKFAHLDIFEEDVEVLENMQTQLISKANSKNKLVQLINSLRDIAKQIEKVSEIIKAEKLLDNILGWIEDRKTKERQKNQLNNLITKTQEITDEITKYEKIIRIEKLVIYLLKLFENRKKKENEQRQLQTLIKNITNTVREQEDQEAYAAKLQKEFDKVFPNICPLCGQKVKK